MEKIIVTAKFEGENTSKLEALMEAAKAAKEVAEAAKAKNIPLIEAAGHKKWELIQEQLNQIRANLIEFSKFAGYRYELEQEARLYDKNGNTEAYCRIRYRWAYNDLEIYINGSEMSRYDVRVDRNLFELSACGKNGFITRWNEFNLINRLNGELERIIKTYIASREEEVRDVYTTKEHMMN